MLSCRAWLVWDQIGFYWWLERAASSDGPGYEDIVPRKHLTLGVVLSWETEVEFAQESS